MITLDSFSTGYNNKTLLNNINAAFPRGQLTALIGRNGSGKTTLLRCMAGLDNRFAGKISTDDTDIRTLSPNAMARRMAIVSTFRPTIAHLSCRQVVEMGRAPYTSWTGGLSDNDNKIVKRAMEQCDMLHLANKSMKNISDGERQRTMTARALAQDTPAILLDEPTAFLDMPARYQLAALLRELAHNDNKAIIFSTHELDIALHYADTVALITDKTLLLLPSSEVAAHPSFRALFALPNDPDLYRVLRK